MTFVKGRQGSIVIESAIIMPLFLAFLMTMISLVQIVVVDIALQTAVTETTKQVAAHMYPAHLVMQENVGKGTQHIVAQIEQAKETFAAAESFTGNYAALIPDPILTMLGWHHAADEIVSDGVHAIALSILKLYIDDRLLQRQYLNVTKATLPLLSATNRSFFGMDVTYKFKLLIPFVTKEIVISKRSYERIWMGS